MGQLTDIRQLKRDLRAKYRSIRENMFPAQKKALDEAILRRLTSTSFYREARTVLCFASTAIEVDTWPLLRQVLSEGKKLALPTCLDAQGSMDFFLVRSLDELRRGHFSLLEPDPEVCPRLTNEKGSVCILPAFAFDPEGYRIGFGKGYYDRFLQRYSGLKAGVCYNSCIAPSLPHGRYDAAADYLVTPKYTLTVRDPVRGGSTE